MYPLIRARSSRLRSSPARSFSIAITSCLVGSTTMPLISRSSGRITGSCVGAGPTEASCEALSLLAASAFSMFSRSMVSSAIRSSRNGSTGSSSVSDKPRLLRVARLIPTSNNAPAVPPATMSTARESPISMSGLMYSLRTASVAIPARASCAASSVPCIAALLT